jgi:hypothetical protein
MRFQYDDQGPYIEKHPAAVLDYQIAWGEWLAAESLSSITSSAWESDPGITVSDDSVDGTYASARIAGGELGATYWVTNTITAGDLVRPQPFRIFVVRK